MERKERDVMWRLNPRRGWDGEERERCDVEYLSAVQVEAQQFSGLRERERGW